MICLTRSQSGNIRIFLNFILILVIIIIVFSIAAQPDRQIEIGIIMHSRTKYGMTKHTLFKWIISKQYMFSWAVNSFWVHLGYMYLDFWSFDKINERRSRNHYTCTWLLAQAVSGIRVLGTCSIIYLLRESWAWRKLLELDSIMMEQVCWSIAATLEVLLLLQLYFVKVIARQ